jgi:di/tricarboxylate transporter
MDVFVPVVAALDAHGWVAIGVLVAATALFLSKKLPVAVTALSIPVVLFATGTLDDPKVAMSGFGNQAALAIAGVFVIGAALKESGVATLMARGIQRVAGTTEVRLLVVLMVASALLSTVMSNAAVVAILLPVCVSLSRRSGVPASRLLLPMGFAAMLGGTVTLIGTAPNFLVDDYLRTARDGVAPALQFEVFDFASVGALITVAGITFMVLVGRRLLPAIKPEERLGEARQPQELASSLALGETLFMLKVHAASKVCGLTIAEAQIRSRYQLDVMMVRRASPVGDRWLQPEPDQALLAGDRLYVQGGEESAWAFAEGEMLQFGLAGPTAIEKILGHGTTLAEVTLPPRSRALGRTIRDIHFRRRFGLNVLMLLRREQRMEEGASDVELQLGDTFVVSGPASRVRRLKARPDFIVLSDLTGVEDVTRAPLAIVLLVAALVPPIFLGWPLAVSALGASLLLVVTGCLSRSALVRAIDWNVIALIMGTLPLGMALAEHGVAELAADTILGLSGGSEAGALILLFVVSAVLAVLTSNAAAAVIVAPVAAVAAETGFDIKAGLLAVAYGASCAFVLPFGNQCNLMVMGPGGYTARDYWRAGAGLTVLVTVTTVLLLVIL